MPTKDGFNPDHPLPRFLTDEPEQQGIGKVRDIAVISSRILKASILVATATGIGIAILSVGSPVALFANVTASLVDKLAPEPARIVILGPVPIWRGGLPNVVAAHYWPCIK